MVINLQSSKSPRSTKTLVQQDCWYVPHVHCLAALADCINQQGDAIMFFNRSYCIVRSYSCMLTYNCQYQMLAHRITGSGEWSARRSCRAPASVAEHPLVVPTTSRRCPSYALCLELEEEGRTEQERTIQDTSVGRSPVCEMANINSLYWVSCMSIYTSLSI